jgi:hypothetical protein
MGRLLRGDLSDRRGCEERPFRARAGVEPSLRRFIEERLEFCDRPERARYSPAPRQNVRARNLPRVNRLLQFAQRREDEVSPLRRPNGPAVRRRFSGVGRFADLELVAAIRAFDGRSATTDESVVEVVLRLAALALDVHARWVGDARANSRDAAVGDATTRDPTL